MQTDRWANRKTEKKQQTNNTKIMQDAGKTSNYYKATVKYIYVVVGSTKECLFNRVNS